MLAVNLVPPVWVSPGGKLFAAANRPWWHNLDLSRTEKLRIRQDLFILDQLAQLVKETATEIYHLSVTQPWVQMVPYLIQLTGIGTLTAMTILRAYPKTLVDKPRGLKKRWYIVYPYR